MRDPMKPLSRLFAPFLVLLFAACTRTPTPEAQPASAPAKPQESAVSNAPVVDDHSYSEPDKVQITDLALDLAIDFDKKQLSGTATYTLDWKDKAAKQLLLDTRDLTIDKIEGEGANQQWSPLQYSLAARDKVFGSKLTIDAPQQPQHVRVTYSTSPDASGLQWLTPEMTEGKKLPFMFSQSQQIHARSWVPLQDTPRVRFTYNAHITAPKDVMVLMSADNKPDAQRTGDYRFTMPQKIPSYLLAIAAGDLVFKSTGTRSGVWAEPAMVDKAAHEFEDTEKMMETAEQLYGPYRWGRYDILVLPPSFPYGGMENPRLTFATPTVIVGDKSLVSLVAHELAHSWSGNLVTFAVDRDAWLNEGVTTYVQGRITEALYGLDLANMEQQIDRQELKKEYATLDPKMQALALKPGVLQDPDDAASDTAYTKGAWFMQFLEQRYGRGVFDAWLRSYFDHFAFQSITTAQFADYLKTTLMAQHSGVVSNAELEEWLYGPGIPSNAPVVESRGFSVVDSARIAWMGSGQLPPPAVTSIWVTQQWIRFLEGLPDTLPLDKLKQLDTAYHFTGTPNGELAMRWYPLTVRSGYTDARPAMGEFLQRIGRRKLIMPTYEELAKTIDGLQFARDVFAKARPGYHPITTMSVQALLDAANPTQQTAAPVAPAASATDAPAPPDDEAPSSDAGKPATQ